MKTKVLFLEEVHDVLAQRLSEAGYDCSHDYDCDDSELSERYSSVFGIVLRSRMVLTRSVLETLPHLRFIARSGSGLENIDLEAASELKIEVFSSPEGNRDAVAEHVIGMLLTIMNRLHLADTEVKSGAWNREINRGNELRGKTIGIIGYGQMGSALAHKLTGFGVNILALDKFPTSNVSSFIRDHIITDLDN